MNTASPISRIVTVTLFCFWVFGVLFFANYAYMFPPSDSDALISSKSIILGNIILAVATATTGIVAIYGYLRQENRENFYKTLGWMSEMRDKFHKDEKFQQVRLDLVQQKEEIRKKLISEFIYDNLKSELKAYCNPDEINENAKTPDWVFLRNFTDYLYFFEEILSYGELLHSSSKSIIQTPESQKLAPILVDHFGWFLRSLYRCCVIGNTEETQEVSGLKFFIHYLAENRYRRLTEVGIFFLCEKTTLDSTNGFSAKIIALLKSQRPDAVNSDSLERIKTRWEPIVFFANQTKH